MIISQLIRQRPTMILKTTPWGPQDEDDLALLASEYESRGAQFPTERVREIVLTGWRSLLAAKSNYRDLLLPMRDFRLTIGKANHLVQCMICTDNFITQHEDKWKKYFPDLADGLSWMIREVRKQIAEAAESEDLRASRDYLSEQKDWVLDDERDLIEAAPSEGVGNRRRQLKNHLICQLFDCLRDPFRIGWKINTKNPEMLRVHISRILRPIFGNRFLVLDVESLLSGGELVVTDPKRQMEEDKELSWKAKGPIWRATDNHLKHLK